MVCTKEKGVNTSDDINERALSLIKEYRENGNAECLQMIVKMYQNMVYKITFDVYIKSKEKGGSKLCLDDLRQEGFLHLIECVNTFEFDKNAKFGTYVYAVVYFRLLQYIKKELSPDGVRHRDIYKCLSVYSKFTYMIREGTPKEVATERICSAYSITKEDLNIMVEKAKGVPELLYLEMPSVDGKSTFGSSIPDDEAIEVFYDIDDKISKDTEAKRLIHIAKDIMSPTEYKVFLLMNCMHGRKGTTPTYEEVAKVMGLSRQRVNKAYLKAINKMKRNLDVQNIGKSIGLLL